MAHNKICASGSQTSNPHLNLMRRSTSQGLKHRRHFEFWSKIFSVIKNARGCRNEVIGVKCKSHISGNGSSANLWVLMVITTSFRSVGGGRRRWRRRRRRLRLKSFDLKGKTWISIHSDSAKRHFSVDRKILIRKLSEKRTWGKKFDRKSSNKNPPPLEERIIFLKRLLGWIFVGFVKVKSFWCFSSSYVYLVCHRRCRHCRCCCRRRRRHCY